MFIRCLSGAVVLCLIDGARAQAAAEQPLDFPAWSALPFVMLLLCIAVLPLVAGAWWHENRNKAIVTALVAVPVAVYLLIVHLTTDQRALVPLGHELFKYVCFIILLGSMFVVSGGIVIHTGLAPTPWTNTVFLAAGGVLANVIGTTGASVLLIRPLLRINRRRRHTWHVPVFFIFVVGNLGGLLTPLGDPPLFLGYLNGVPFIWTMTLWKEWLLVNGLVLGLFVVWDAWAWRREPVNMLSAPPRSEPRLRMEGLLNVPLLAGIIGGVLVQGVVQGEAGDALGAAWMVVMAGLSWQWTPQRLRHANGFTWQPIIEVAVLFFGIFVAMVPALELLKLHSGELGLSAPWHYFWLTGALSAVLDNAPTYLAFTTAVAGEQSIGSLIFDKPDVLAAISAGAVFFGALTYIGNGPNFMVKAIAEDTGYVMPTFVGYMACSCLCLVPIFALVTFVFFR